MPSMLLQFAVSDNTHISITPADLTVEVVDDAEYLVTVLPVQSYEARIVDSLGYDSGWVAGAFSHKYVGVDDTAVAVNVIAQPIPMDVSTVSPITLCRYYTGEVIPANKTELDTFFMDAFIGGILNEVHGNVLRAAGRLWMMKSAEYARLIDLDEAGSNRKLTQRFKQALLMAKEFEDAGVLLDEGASGAVRVGGRAIDLRTGVPNEWRTKGEYFFHGVEASFVDMVPTGVIRP